MSETLITIRQYAETQRITYEAARRCFQRYKGELDGKYIQRDRCTYLKREAVEYLNEKRKARYQVVEVIEPNKDELERLQAEVERLEDDNRRLKAEADELRDIKDKYIAALERLNEMSGKIIALEDKSEKKGIFKRLFGR